MRFVIRTDEQAEGFLRKLREHIKVCPTMVSMEKFKPPHTSDQNAKLHVMIGDLAEFTGHTLDEMKLWLKGLGFWPETTITVAGVSRRVAKSASSKADDPISKREESDIIERLYQVGATLDGFVWSE